MKNERGGRQMIEDGFGPWRTMSGFCFYFVVVFSSTYFLIRRSIPRIFLIRLFSFHTVSYSTLISFPAFSFLHVAYFHSAPFSAALNFIPSLLLLHLIRINST